MMMAITNEYRQVQVHRRKKFHHDNHAGNEERTLVMINENSSLIT